jgi:Fatty acid desaturase
VQGCRGDAVAAAPAVPGRSSAGVGRGSGYAELARLVRAAGLLGRCPAYYRARIALNVGLLAVGWTVFALLGSSWWHLVIAAFLAVMFVQVGFLSHDAGHRQVFRSGRHNDLLGLLCANLLIGLSYSWWIDKHNRHHAHPNDVGCDPDINGGGVAFTAASQHPRRTMDRSGHGRSQLPDRASPVPQHAKPLFASGASAGPGLLPGARPALPRIYSDLLLHPDAPIPARRRGHSPSARPYSRGETVIILGVILLIAGFLLKISILWTIGIILVVIGVILAILGATGHAIAGRRHFF